MDNRATLERLCGRVEQRTFDARATLQDDAAILHGCVKQGLDSANADRLSVAAYHLAKAMHALERAEAHLSEIRDDLRARAYAKRKGGK